MLENAQRTRKARNRARQRAYRARIGDGVAIAPLPYSILTLDRLIRLQYLDEKDCGDRAKVGTAAARMIENIEI